eukprot:1544647-Amphidinium_carterae.1
MCIRDRITRDVRHDAVAKTTPGGLALKTYLFTYVTSWSATTEHSCFVRQKMPSGPYATWSQT